MPFSVSVGRLRSRRLRLSKPSKINTSWIANATALLSKKILADEVNRAIEPLKEESEKLRKSYDQLMNNFCSLRHELERSRSGNWSRWSSCSSGLGLSIASTISTDSINEMALKSADLKYLPTTETMADKGALVPVKPRPLSTLADYQSLGPAKLPIFQELPFLIDVRELEFSLLGSEGEDSPVRGSLVELNVKSSVKSRQLNQTYSASAPTSRTSSPPPNDELDKTGFARLRVRSLKKATNICQDLSTRMTIGPNATSKGTNSTVASWSSSTVESSSRSGNRSIESTPVSKLSKLNGPGSRLGKVCRPMLLDDEPACEEKFCARRILAEIDRISYMEAQEAKFRRAKIWSEFDRRTDDDMARKLAQQQEESLKRQQAKMQEMARQQEESMRKQEEFSLQQQAKEREFSQKQEETRKKQLEAEMLQREKVMEKKAFFQKVFQNYQQFSTNYREVLEILRSHEQLKKILFYDLESIKGCHEKFNGLIAKCKMDHINKDDVACSQHLLDTATAAFTKAKNELIKIEDIKKKEEAAKLQIEKEEEQKRKIENELKKIEEEKQSAACQGQYINISPRFKEYEELHSNLLNVENTLSKFMTDDSIKKFRSDCQKAINVPANAISAQSSAHLYDKYKKIVTFLQKQPVVISDKRITATAHPLGPLYALNYLAIKCVKLGELSVANRPEAAYPVAAVIIAIWTELPEFGNLLLSHFYKASPYLIPAYWERNEEETEEQYYKRLGFLYPGSEREELDKFLKRQSGIMRLYCALIVTSQNRANASKKHPLPISEAWKWLTAFVSLPPKADISATLLLDMLEVTGYKMLSTYGVQFRKLLHLICISYLPLVEKVTPPGRGGPVTRLRGFLERLITGKGIHPPKDMLPANFW